MNVLQRRMFAAGDVAQQIPQEVIDYAAKLGINTTGLNADQIRAQLQREIDKINQAEKPGLVGGKGSLLFDYTDPIDYGIAALGITGIGLPAASYLKSLNVGRKLYKAAKTPLGAATGLVGADLLLDNDELAQEEIPVSIQEALESVQTKSSLSSTTSKDPKVVKKNNEEKTKKEIESINSILEAYDLKDKQNREAFIQKRQERKNRNTGIFLNEMAKAAAGTDNLADAIAIGAANSSDAVMKADDAEALSQEECLKKLREEKEKGALKTTDKNAIIKEYNKAAGDVEGNNIMLNEIKTLRQLLATNNTTGLQGWMNRLVTRAQGFTGTDLDLNSASKAANIGKFLEARMVQALLDEKGKTISDADRALIKDLLGNIQKTTSSKAEIIDLLRLTEATLAKSSTDARNLINVYEAEYMDVFPNLRMLKRKFNTGSAPVDEDEISIADRSDVIT